MTLLVIAPDYASHVLPLANLATGWRDRGERVVVATGPATAGIVEDFGYHRVDLQLGRGSNPGVIRAENQPTGEGEALRGFFAATRQGMVATLSNQARRRRGDQLWKPVEKATAVLRIIDQVRPDQVLVDHLAFAARVGLHAETIPYGDVVLGHPSALPVGEEVYGYPTAWPTCLRPEAAALRTLRRECEEVRDAFTADWNAALVALSSAAATTSDAFTIHGNQLLFNYPRSLHPERRTALLPSHTFLGSAVRTERSNTDVAQWLQAAGAPIVYASLGSFLSARSDVLATIAAVLRRLEVRVALAVGSADRRVLGQLPDHWLVREYLPQVEILDHASLAITHGGNNSITEALSAGVPLMVLPLSTDQFAGAAAVESAGVGIAVDPQLHDVAGLRSTVDKVMTGPMREAAHRVKAEVNRTPGPALAFQAF